MTRLALFNTLTGKKEPFAPLRPRRAGIYTCGPTVYGEAHIGNLRAYVFADTLRRTLEYSGYEVTQIVNITDVGHLSSDADQGEDKMAKGLRREGMPQTLEAMRALGEKYAKRFCEDIAALGIETPHRLPRASDHIAEDIGLISILLEKGAAYKTSDGIYFDTARFPEYGKLGRVNLGGERDGARVAPNPEKRGQKDFALWKLNGAIGFDAPWGKGFPGWHVECSAMSRAYLGQPFDIHTGGVDHIPIHHNNEIAQSEAAYGAPLANVWMHVAHLNIGESKMAKSGGNFLTLPRIEAEIGISPSAYRYYLLGAHYRTPMVWSAEAARAARAFYKKILAQYLSWAGEKSGTVERGIAERFDAAILDDLDTPRALALLPELLAADIPAGEKKATLEKFDRVLGLGFKEQSAAEKPVPDPVLEKAARMDAARRAGDFKTSDALRREIEESGEYLVKNGPDGSIIERK